MFSYLHFFNHELKTDVALFCHHVTVVDVHKVRFQFSLPQTVSVVEISKLQQIKSKLQFVDDQMPLRLNKGKKFVIYIN